MHDLLHFFIYFRNIFIFLIFLARERDIWNIDLHKTFVCLHLTNLQLLFLHSHKALPSAQWYITHNLSHTNIFHLGLQTYLTLHLQYFEPGFSSNIPLVCQFLLPTCYLYASLVDRAFNNGENWDDNIITRWIGRGTVNLVQFIIMGIYM